MSDDAVMLAVTYDPDKLTFPVEVSIKLDGVAADFYKTPNGWLCQSRQGKPLPSTGHIIRLLNENSDKLQAGTHIIGELTVVGVPVFKEAAGIIRRKVEDTRIVLNIYDAYIAGEADTQYKDRIKLIEYCMKQVNGRKARKTADGLDWSVIRRVPVVGMVADVAGLSEHLTSMDHMMQGSPMFEGFMIRCTHGPDSLYRIGKRSRNMMRYKPVPTIDLQVVGFEEAIDKNGNPKGMVGRINVLYSGSASTDGMNEFTDWKTIGVGPGCLTHEERTKLWEGYQRLLAKGETLQSKNLIAEIEYMKDEGYDALRQAVFKRWRMDKEEASEQA